MKAFKIQGQFSYPGYSVRMTTVSLPWVNCEVCKCLTGQPHVYHPSLKCSPRILSILKTAKKAVSVEEYQKILLNFHDRAESLWDLPPRAQLGVQKFAMEEPPPDFMTDLNCPLISERALGILKDHGIQVYTGEVEILCPRKPLKGWYAVDFPGIRLMTEKSFRESGRYQCPRCGDFKMKPNMTLTPQQEFFGHSDHELIKDRWPAKLGVARARESGLHVASPEFISVWKKHKLTGINFVPIGKWV